MRLLHGDGKVTYIKETSDQLNAMVSNCSLVLTIG